MGANQSMSSVSVWWWVETQVKNDDEVAAPFDKVAEGGDGGHAVIGVVRVERLAQRFDQRDRDGRPVRRRRPAAPFGYTLGNALQCVADGGEELGRPEDVNRA